MAATHTPQAHHTDRPALPMVILGADDWLVFARDALGVCWYTVVECDGTWLDAPNGGNAEYGSKEHAEDWAFMLGHLAGTPSSSSCWLLLTDPDTSEPLTDIAPSRGMDGWMLPNSTAPSLHHLGMDADTSRTHSA